MNDSDDMELGNTFSSEEGNKIISKDGESYRIELDPHMVQLTPEDIQRLFPEQIAKTLLSHSFQMPTNFTEKEVRELFQNGQSTTLQYEDFVYEKEKETKPLDRHPDFVKRTRND